VRPRRIPGLPDCPECNATVEELVHIAPGIAAAKPCGCVFAPGEFFGDELLEADHERELVTDGGEQTVYVVRRRGGTPHRGHIHLSKECHKLQRADNHRTSTREAIDDEFLCSYCTGEAGSGGPSPGQDPKETRKRLSKLDPSDLGLSEPGERPGGGR
jgi:hypothetical protein